MRAETKRRLAVFAVCALGVGCLYWVPEIASSPNQLSGQGQADQESRPRATVTMTATRTVRSPAASDDPADSSPDATAIEETSQAPGTPKKPLPQRSATKTAKPSGDPSGDPTSSRKQRQVRPSPVGNVTLMASDYDSLSVAWSAAENAEKYRVWLNGYEVQTTTGTSAKLDWFNSDDTHVVQIQAIDGDGDASRQSRALTLRRPPESTDKPERPEGTKPNGEPSPETTPESPKPPPDSRDGQPVDPPDDPADPTEEPSTPGPEPESSPTPTPTPTPTPSPTPDPADESPSSPGPNGFQSEGEQPQGEQQQQRVAPDRRSPSASASETPSDDASQTPEAGE